MTDLELNMDDYDPMQRLVIQMMIDSGAQAEEERVVGELAEMWAEAFDEDNTTLMSAIDELRERLGYA